MIIFTTASFCQRCCCFKDIRYGCFACSIYTLILYCLFATVASFHIHQVFGDKILLTITIILCAFSILMIITSILLIIGLYSENASLLIPWIFSLFFTTLYELFIIFYLLKIRSINPLLITFYTIDFIVCIFNLYCTISVCCLYLLYKRTCSRCFCHHCKCSHIQQQLDSGNIITSNPDKSTDNESNGNYTPFTDIITSNTYSGTTITKNV